MTRPKLMVVGEAWGEEEARQREAFVGPSGELLNKLLFQAGVPRSRADVTNVVEARPPKDNDFSSFPKEAINAGIEALRRRIASSAPNCILALGNHALEVLTGFRGIERRAGGVYHCALEGAGGEDLSHVKVIGAMHPAFILRGRYNPWFHLNLHFFKRAVRHSTHAEFPFRAYNYITKPDFFTVIDTLEKYAKLPSLAFDIEGRGFKHGTTGRNQHITCLGFAPSAHEALVIPFTRGIFPYWTLDEEVEVWGAVIRLLEDSNVVKIVHNIAFEAAVLGRWYGVRIRGVEDTMIKHHVRWPELPNSLGFCTQYYTEREYHKMEDEDFDKVPDERLWRYNGDDCMATYEVAEVMGG